MYIVPKATPLLLLHYYYYWRSGVEVIVEKERIRWIQRNTVKTRKRAAEKIAYESKKRSEERRRNNKRQRTIDQCFR